MPSRYELVLVNERHLIDLPQSGYSGANLRETALTQRNHTFFNSGSLDFGGRTAVHDHLSNVVGQVQQFADRGAAVIAGSRAFQATRAFREGVSRNSGRVQSRLANFLRGVFL